MRETATVLQGFNYYVPDFRPFDELEVPGTSVLVASAAAAGYYPIAEYQIRKIDKKDRRRRRNGRADLWFIAENKSYSFEMKRAYDYSSQRQLEVCLTAAVSNVSEIPVGERHHAYGVVIAPVFDPSCCERYESLSQADYIFSIEDDEEPHVYFYFKKHVD